MRAAANLPDGRRADARAGQIIISEHTMQALDASVHDTQLDAVQVKGHSARMQIADVIWSAR